MICNIPHKANVFCASCCPHIQEKDFCEMCENKSSFCFSYRIFSLGRKYNIPGNELNEIVKELELYLAKLS